MINKQIFKGERPLYRISNQEIVECRFENGESAIKEGTNLESLRSSFNSKYPFWHCNDVRIDQSFFDEGGRAAIWYSHHIQLQDSKVIAPKIFRDATYITIDNCEMNTEETLWDCDEVTITNTNFKGNYILFHSKNIVLDHFNLDGNYSFQHCENIKVTNSKIKSKDAFWNAKNILVENCEIDGEYLGWYSENLTLVNCTIRGTQPLSYAENVKLINCKMINTDLSFELSTVDADVTTTILSVKNPKSGRIKAKGIGEFIIEETETDPGNTELILEVNRIGCTCNEN